MYVDGDVDGLDALLAQHEQEHLAERRADDRVDQLVERDDVDRQPEQLHTINGRNNSREVYAGVSAAKATYVRMASRRV